MPLLYKRLELLNNEISTKFLSAIKARIELRKNTNLITLARHLHSPNQQLSKSVLSYATDMLKRLYPVGPTVSEVTNTLSNAEPCASNTDFAIEVYL